jgi:hypothetical protein
MKRLLFFYFLFLIYIKPYSLQNVDKNKKKKIVDNFEKTYNSPGNNEKNPSVDSYISTKSSTDSTNGKAIISTPSSTVATSTSF